MENSIVRFDIVDSKTGRVVGSAKSRSRARLSVDKRDNAYGAYRYRAVAVYAADETKTGAVAVGFHG